MTLRELSTMATGRNRAHWQHTSSVLALLANAHRDPKKSRPFKPADFDPTGRKRRGKGQVISFDKFCDDLVGSAGKPKRGR